MVRKAPTSDSPLAGKMVHCYIFGCIHCGKAQPFYAPDRPSLTKDDAEDMAREKGWTHRKAGWTCGDCSTKYHPPRTPYSGPRDHLTVIQ